MSFRPHTLARGTAAALLFASILSAAAVSAQPADHLECYRGHDDLRLNGSVDIDSVQFGLSSAAPAPNGNAFTSFLATLNGGATGVGDCTTPDGVTQVGGFAGRCDWRLPTIVELQTLRTLPCTTTPCHDPILGPATQPVSTASTWSSTTDRASRTRMPRGPSI